MADRSGYIGRAPSDSSVTIARQTNVTTGIQTTFVFNAGYDVGYLDVFINGTKLINSTDFVATDTQNVTLTVPAQSGDSLEFVAYKAFNLSRVITESSGLTVNGDVSVTGNVTGNGSGMSGIVTTLTAGNNIQLDGSNGSVTITGLASTDVIVSERVLVQGITTSTGGLRIGTGGTVGPVASGVVTYFGDGSQLTGITAGATLSAGSGSQRIVLTSLNSGTMTSAATDAELTYNSTTDTLSVENISIGGTLTYEDVTNVDSVGVVTARSGIRVGTGGTVGPVGSGIVTYFGDGSQLTGISAGGISTTAASPNANTTVTLNLSNAQHHELTLTAGITTITTTGGAFGESHSVVLIQPSSGITTVSFSDFFLFPSGADPAFSQGNGKIDLVSFMVKRVGAAGTQLLASAGLNYQ